MAVCLPSNIVRTEKPNVFKFRHIDGDEDEELYFTYAYNMAACIYILCCDHLGDTEDHGLTGIKIHKLRTSVLPHIKVKHTGQVQLYCDTEGAPLETVLWKLAGREYEQYLDLVVNGTQEEERLDQISRAFEDDTMTKEDVCNLFKLTFGKKVERYRDFIQAQRGK